MNIIEEYKIWHYRRKIRPIRTARALHDINLGDLVCWGTDVKPLSKIERITEYIKDLFGFTYYLMKRYLYGHS